MKTSFLPPVYIGRILIVAVAVTVGYLHARDSYGEGAVAGLAVMALCQPVSSRIQAGAACRELNKKYCWFHPRAAVLPGFGENGCPAVILTLQKHLGVSDYYSGLYVMRSDDLGKTWSGPTEIPERGVMPGNFGAAAITPEESWVTDAEFIHGVHPHPRGADGTVWVARVLWSQPNRTIKP